MRASSETRTDQGMHSASFETATPIGDAASNPRSLFRYVFNDVEQCLTTALFTARACIVQPTISEARGEEFLTSGGATPPSLFTECVSGLECV